MDVIGLCQPMRFSCSLVCATLRTRRSRRLDVPGGCCRVPLVLAALLRSVEHHICGFAAYSLLSVVFAVTVDVSVSPAANRCSSDAAQTFLLRADLFWRYSVAPGRRRDRRAGRQVATA